MKPGWRKELGRVIASIKDEKEANELLCEILTPAEYEEVVKRWQIVKLLEQGVPQREIRDRLHVSIATVTRGARELKYGKGSFKKFYNRIYSRGK